jgi:hypothetical protein
MTGSKEDSMKKRRLAVFYRENCGGILRDLAHGFRSTVTSLAELDLYDDLRERIFEQPSSSSEQKQKISA